MNLDIFLLFPLMFLLGTQTVGEHLYVSHFILLILLALAVFNRLLNGKLVFPPIFTAWSLFFFTSIITSLYANNNLDALRYSSQILIFYCGVFFVFMRIKYYKDIQSLLVALNIGLGFNAIAGAIQTVQWIVKNGFVLIADDDWFRVKGLCTSPTDYVMQLIAGLFLVESISRAPLRRFIKIAYLFLLVLSMSRSALLVIFIISIIGVTRLQYSRVKIFAFSLVLLIIIPTFISTDAGWLVAQRAMDIGNSDLNSRRIVVFEDVVNKSFSGFLEFIFGNGYGTYQFFNPIADELFTNTHNIYLFILYSGGLIGLIAFLGTLSYLFISAVRFRTLMKRIPHLAGLERFSSSLLLLLLSVFLIGTVETNIASVGTGWLVGVLSGIPLVIYRFNFSNRTVDSASSVC